MSLSSAIRSPQVWAWWLFDLGNSSYGVLFLALLFPVYYREVLAGGGEVGDLYWGLAFGGSVGVSALLSPIIGTYADRAGKRRLLLRIFTCIAVAGTASLSYAPSLGLILCTILLVITNVGYLLGGTIYDTYLAEVSTPLNRSSISGIGWALGYLGGIAAAVIFMPWYRTGFLLDPSGYLTSFVLVAVFFLFFAAPSCFVLPEVRPREGLEKIGVFKQLRQTFQRRGEFPQVFRLIVGFAVSYIALSTIFSFFTIYTNVTLKAAVAEVTVIFLIFQIVGFFSSLIAGIYGDRVGELRILRATLVGWILVVIALLLSPPLKVVYLIAAFCGCLSGPGQASARALASRLIPREQSGEFFGFFSMAARLAGSLGPALFGVISWATASQPLALSANIVFLLVGLAVLSKLRSG
jgi:UMF1 family MFS transporter